MRKLATIQTIKQLLPIEGADAIELALFENILWKCVVKKNEFAVGDKAVYFEIDSLLPLVPQFEFLARGSTPKKTLLEDGRIVEGYRLKTIKLRGQLSQGLALPIEKDYEEGKDLTDIIGVHKYEPPVNPQLAGQVKGNFPSFIPKTDEERIQTCWNIVEKYQDIKWYSALKVDGSSCTIYHLDDFGVCSRNLDLLETEGNSFWKVANKYNLKEKMPKGYAIQSELHGEGIQGNKHQVKGIDLAVFNVYDINNGKYLNLKEAREFTENLGLKFVEIVEENITLERLTMDDLMAKADATGLEGLVFRPMEEINDISFGRVSFKVISNRYLLKEK